MGCRRLLALLNGLPPDSATWRSEQPWLVSDHLTASLIEITDKWFRQLAIGQGFKAHDLGEQIEIPRPGDEPPKPKTPIAVQNMRALMTEQKGT